MIDFPTFFTRATGLSAPYPYQARLAGADRPDVLHVPTGLGKTAAVTLAWAYRRRVVNDSETPRRLVWCLPMRVLAEQTCANIEGWLSNLGLLSNSDADGISVHLLMGGEPELRTATWIDRPGQETVLIGTQDMLLSRALMRGYGMSRYQWPMHFALLHNDALWVFDEIQLMGPALATASQIEAFRRDLPLARDSRSLWVSATLDPQWLATVDFKPHIDGLKTAALDEADRQNSEVQKRLNASKQLHQAQTRLTSDNAKSKAADYAHQLADEVFECHRQGTNTLVIVNNVERAQAIYRTLIKRREAIDLLLLHARFRPTERRAIEQHLRESPPPSGRVIVATQAIEAGVDITSRCLFTELAPWSSLVQRFGRCNRYGESDTAEVYWVEVEDDPKLALPYDTDSLDNAREKLTACTSASSKDLPKVDARADTGLVLRRKDFLALFNTDPDLSGADIDISPYIRDPGTAQLQVFWRDLATSPPEEQPQPAREELCPVSLGQFDAKKQPPRIWDTLQEQWIRLQGDPRPGMTLLLDNRDGGYDPELGYLATSTSPVEDLSPKDPDGTEQPESIGGDDLSRMQRRVELTDHLLRVAQESERLCAELDEPDHQEKLRRVGLWHDVGKAHEVFQQTLVSCLSEDDPQRERLWAKSECRGKHARPAFRHELASMLAWLAHNEADPDRDLIAYLIAAHHGRVRMGLRSMPIEKEPEDKTRSFARGIWDDDVLPQVDLGGGQHVPETTLRLDLMELGEGPQGPSWTARTQRLLQELGPFRLAWLETLARLADWRASRMEQEDRP